MEVALDAGLEECKFWDMTINEVERYLQSYQRREERRLKEQANFDYTLGNLIGISCGRFWAKQCKYPQIYDAYPTLFSKQDIEEARARQKQQLSINRLKEFVKKHNEEVN